MVVFVRDPVCTCRKFAGLALDFAGFCMFDLAYTQVGLLAFRVESVTEVSAILERKRKQQRQPDLTKFQKMAMGEDLPRRRILKKGPDPGRGRGRGRGRVGGRGRGRGDPPCESEESGEEPGERMRGSDGGSGEESDAPGPAAAEPLAPLAPAEAPADPPLPPPADEIAECVASADEKHEVSEPSENDAPEPPPGPILRVTENGRVLDEKGYYWGSHLVSAPRPG